MASFFTSPTSFRVNNMLENPTLPPALVAQNPFEIFKKKPVEAHPSLPHLVLLVFEAVMEVVCVALPGYIIATLGHFDAEKQKFLANLNIQLFTPCLIFTKLASQLNADKLADLGIIPVIFVIMTFVSYMVGLGVTKAFGFAKRPANFVIAMGVFGNSNSLPISLVISLSQTISGLHWDRIKGDNDDEVAARGILYLLVFQQLGQLVRWSWGYHVLLAPKDKYEEYNQEQAEAGRLASGSVDGDSINERRRLLDDGSIHAPDADVLNSDDEGTMNTESDAYVPAGRTPIANHSRASPADTDDDDSDGSGRPSSAPGAQGGRKSRKHRSNKLRNHSVGPGPTNGHIPQPDENADDRHMQSFPRIRNNDDQDMSGRVKGLKLRAVIFKRRLTHATKAFSSRQFYRLPIILQRGLRMLGRGVQKASGFLWEFMNPPLWAMLLAILVASIPNLQRAFFEEGSFVRNSVTRAVSQTGGVAVPLILVVLGANLARNTQKQDSIDAEEKEIGTKLLVASLMCRMLLPTIIMAPILAFFAKYVPISILDDPIFVIVCFLLTGAPSALQLAQICQLNAVYEGVMGKILFQSYVVWILPSTLILVMLALEVVEAAR